MWTEPGKAHDGRGHQVLITEDPAGEMLLPGVDEGEADYYPNMDVEVFMRGGGWRGDWYRRSAASMGRKEL